MYAMSWERDTTSYKYETIQDPYSIQYDEIETDVQSLSLDELLEQELELEEELEIEEML